MRIKLYAICLVITTLPSHATELNYHFISPSMGGNPLNGTYLLNQASEQNKFKDPAAQSSAYKPKSPLEQFKSNLQSAILGQVARSSVQSMFDSKGNIITGTTLNFDLSGSGNSDFSVQVGTPDSKGNVAITISDGISETVLIVPYKPIN